MKITDISKNLCVAATAFLAFLPQISAAAFPDRPVKVMVAYSPGGGADQIARPLAQGLSVKWGQPVVVENKPGANGMIGAGTVATSPPDGYTIMLGAAPEVAANVALYAKVPYDPLTAFDPVTLIAETPTVLVVDPKLPIHSVKDLVAYATERRGKMTFASGGIGSTQHFAGELFNNAAALGMIHVPYKSGGPQVTALVAGEVPTGFSTLLPSIPFVREGRLRALAVSSSVRSPSLPSVPTMAEAGYPKVDIVQWYAAWVPASTPAAIVQKIAADIKEVINSPDFTKRATDMGLRTVTSTPQELRQFQRSEIAKFREMVKMAKIKVE